MVPRTLKAEFNDTPHLPGVLSAARTADPNSASCQFFICLGDATFLDGQYTAFGKIADEGSMEVLKKIGSVKTVDPGTGEKSQPVEPVIISKMTVAEVE